MCSELVTVSYPDHSGFRLSQTANLEEIGERSAALLVETPVRRGSALRITCGRNTLEGTVRSCTPVQELGYWMEVLLDGQSHWSERVFMPKHLLRLERGARQGQAIPLGAA